MFGQTNTTDYNENIMIEQQSSLYAVVAVILILKMIALSWFTGRIRVSRQVS